MRIEAIDERSSQLKAVKQLWRANSGTLGFLPAGAFEEYAANGNILVALDAQGQCIGYLLFRTSQDRVVTIHHLCVDESMRGQGLASKLLNHLKSLTKNQLGIRLSCRRDFEANSFWPTQGFVVQTNKPGRGQQGTELTVWWFDHGHPNLFTWAAKERAGSRLRVVIDANVFFDLHGENGSEESKALLADWLQDSVELCITGELFNEIEKNDDALDRQRKRLLASGYPVVGCDPKEFERIEDSIRPLFPEQMSDRDKADMRHLARTIASDDAQCFVTRDGSLLANIADNVYESFGVSVVSPAGLACKLDEFRRETEYKAHRLAGTLSTIRRIRGGEVTFLTPYFQRPELRETKAKFQRQLRRYLADPERFICQVAQDTQNIPIALIAYDGQNPHELSVPMLRVIRGSLAGTLARYLTFQAVLLSSRERKPLTRITDVYLTNEVVAALQEDLFVEADDGWLKVNLLVLEDAHLLARRLHDLCSLCRQESSRLSQLVDVLQREGSTEDTQTMVDIERALWPAKIADARIPAFLVPIQAHWAHQLFDENLARQTLFGAEAELALSREGVYYRSRWFPGGLQAPGRILWYVSRSPQYRGTMRIRACSRLEEVAIDSPKDLYRRFRRLGVFGWNQVFDIADRDIDKKIMALRFSDTELFASPVSSKKAEAILVGTGHQLNNFQSPLQITAEAFAEIYALGQQLPERPTHAA
jgi:GNAT superfamily N-acetyltransferase/predicted nucleic acid-binding protein